MPNNFVAAIANIEEDEALKLMQEMLDKGEDPARILALCQEAMAIVGQRFEAGEYFLPELIMSGEILRKISDVVKPRLAVQTEEAPKLGKVVLGTVRGDIHDIGKDIVAFILEVNGFQVHDLGVDVPEERFVQAIREVKPEIVGLSGFLTLAYESMKTTVEAISAAGLREQVKIMVGGGQINEMIRDYTGADGYGSDAMAAVSLAREWTKKKL